MLRLVVSTVLGASVGILVGYAWAQFYWKKRVGEAADFSRALEYGKLGESLDEGGHPSFRILARNLNGVSANFQEILLLFVHHVRNLRLSIDAAGRGKIMKKQDLLNELREMDQVLNDFDYYRVRIEGDSITDTGVALSSENVGVAEVAVSGEFVMNSSHEAGGSYDD